MAKKMCRIQDNIFNDVSIVKLAMALKYALEQMESNNAHHQVVLFPIVEVNFCWYVARKPNILVEISFTEINYATQYMVGGQKNLARNIT